MKYFIIRNTTIENLFGNLNISYSNYDDFINIDKDADIIVWFYLLPIKPSPELLVCEIESYFRNIQLVYNQIHLYKTFYIFTLQDIQRVKYQICDFSVECAVNSFNKQVIEFADLHNNIKVIDFADFTRNYSCDQLIDWKFYFMSKSLINPRMAKSFRHWFNRQIEIIQNARKKCIVLDLDNTLWGGILGEDGYEGVKIGGDYPGSAFLMFQQNLLYLSQSGVILTVCSKNNEKDVLSFWDNNPYLTLNREHFPVYRINWKNKTENIVEIADELNIGLESIVFIDDNPSERELVKQFLPMVEVPEFPEQPYLLPSFFDNLLQKYFMVYNLTEEDRGKTEQYFANSKRKSIQKNFSDIKEYLTSLEICLEIQTANAFNISRFVQMTQKTNQFNLTTRRYNDFDIQGFIDSGHLLYCLSVKDKFGDSGITGGIILKYLNKETVEINSLFLSCRVLGKGIETAFVYSVINKLKKLNINKVLSTYIRTQKNEQVKDFYEKLGFNLLNENQTIKNYSIDIQSNIFSIENYYKITIQ